MAAILQLRRGTTTPSLAQSELFFNTTNNTLVVGDGSTNHTLVKIGSNTGDVTLLGNLNVSGPSIFTAITGSSLYITGDSKIDGNLRLGGNIFLGSGSDGDLVNINASFSGSILPDTTEVYDIGSNSYKYKNLYVLSASIEELNGVSLDSFISYTNLFTQSADSRLDNLELETGSISDEQSVQDGRLNNLESFSSSQEDLNLTFATTGSNIFIGDQSITGSLNVGESITSQVYLNPKSLDGFTVPNGYNAMLVGPIDVNGEITLEGDSSLLILDQITLPDGVISGSSQLTTEFDTRYLNTNGDNVISGSSQVNADSITNFDENVLDKINLEGVISGSSQVTITDTIGFGTLSGSLKLTDDAHAARLSSLETETGSIQSVQDAQDSRLDSIETYTASLDSTYEEKASGTHTLVSGSTQIDVNDTQNFQIFSSSVDSRLDLIEGDLSSSVNSQLENIHQYTSSLKQAVDVDGQNLTIYGNLTVQGETTTLNTTELLIEDKVLSLASGSTTSAEADGAGLHISGANVSILWNDSQNTLDINKLVSSSVGFKGDGSELTDIQHGNVDFGGSLIVSGSSQLTQSLDLRYLEINGDNVVSGSSQITITSTTGFSTFSGSLKTTDDGQDSRLDKLESFSSSQESKDSTLSTLTSSYDGRLNNLESFSSSQESKDSTLGTYTSSIDTKFSTLGTYTSSIDTKFSTLETYTASIDSDLNVLHLYTQSNDTNISNLYNSASQYQSFSESIDSTIKNKIDLEGVVSSSSDTSTISLSIDSGVVSGVVIGGVVSGSHQVTQSLDLRYEQSGSVAQLVGENGGLGSLGSAAWYNVSSSISNGDPAVLGNAGAVKDYIDEQLLIIGAGDITSVIAGDGMSGGADSGPATLTLDTASAHFNDGVNESITPFSSSVSASIAALESSSGYINYVTNSIEQLTGIEVADFDNNVAVTFIGGTLKFIFGTPAVPSSIAASLSGFLVDRFNQVEDEYDVTASWNNGGYTLISASLYEDSTLLTQVGVGTSLSFNTTTSGSHTYRLEYTGSSPLDGTIYTTSTTTTGTISKSNPATPTLTPSPSVQLGASGNQIEQGATGSISFTTSAPDPSNGWNLGDITTNVSTPYEVTGSATGSSSLVITATVNYDSPIGDNDPDLSISTNTTRTYTKIRSLRYGASDVTSFTQSDLENISEWDTSLGGSIGTIVKGTTNPSGQSVTISWSGDKYHYIVFDSARSNLSNITTNGFGIFGSFTLTTVGQYKVYKTNTLQAGGAGSSITYTLT